MLRYYQYFGLQRDPFLDTPDPQFYFESRVVRQDLRRVLTGIDEADGVTVVIGASGAGKTSLFTKVEQILLGDDTAIVGKIFERFGATSTCWRRSDSSSDCEPNRVRAPS
jgi:type II secretory pathway predicted ATPase ExeA